MGQSAALRDAAHPAVPKILLVASNKGGVGKTTTIVNLSVAAAYDGANVGVIDFDAQHSFDFWALKRRKLQGLPQVAVYWGRIEMYEALLARAYAAAHDIIMIDTPPNIAEHPESMNSLIELADFVLVPTLTGSFDLQAVGALLRDHLKPAKGNRVAFLLNRIAVRTNAFHSAQAYLNSKGRVCSTSIRQLANIEGRMFTGGSVMDAEGEEKGKDDFRDVWNFVSAELGR